MEMFRAIRFASLLIAMLLGNVSAHASEFYGLLRERDLTSFGFLRLDMRPAHAVSIEPGSWALETELGYQNTWSMSSNVHDYLTSLEPQGRRKLGPAEIAAIRSLPGESYLLDVESAPVDFTIHYKFSQKWSGYMTVGGIFYQGGYLDGFIERFHHTVGFQTFGRPALERNQINGLINLKSMQYTYSNLPDQQDFSDPTIGLRYGGFDLPMSWHLVAEVAAKIAVNGERPFYSTGNDDYGVQLSLQKQWDHHALYLSVADVYYSGARTPVIEQAQWIPTVVLGYEYAWTAHTNLNVQAYTSSSVYNRNQTDLEELLGRKYQYSLGLRHRIDNVVLTFGVTENIQNLDNTPDIGFQFGVAWLPKAIRRD
jgi:hypothetical protein